MRGGKNCQHQHVVVILITQKKTGAWTANLQTISEQCLIDVDYLIFTFFIPDSMQFMEILH